MLATMAAAIEDLRPAQAKSKGQRDLAELQLVRDSLVGDRTAITNRGKHLRTPVAKRLNKQRLKQIERQLKRIDAEVRKRLQAEEALERRAEILTSIPGISDVTAAGLLVHMPELGTLTGARAASLAGLAPVTRESGSWKGRSFIQGGRQPRAPTALHARGSRDPVQSQPQAKVRGSRGQGKTAQGRPYGGDAETPRPRQHPGAAGPHLDGACTRSRRVSAMHPTGAQGRTAPSASSRLTQRPHPAFTATVCPPCLPGPAPDGTLLTWILPFVPETIGNGQLRVRPARNYNHNKPHNGNMCAGPEMAFRCTCASVSDVRAPIGTDLTRSAFKTPSKEPVRGATWRSRRSPLGRSRSCGSVRNSDCVTVDASDGHTGRSREFLEAS